MNKIDAFFVTISIWLVWTFVLLLAPRSFLFWIYWGTSAICVGVLLALLHIRLVHGSADERRRKILKEIVDFEMAQWAWKNEALQAKIDALMLEHCPEEMTEEQKAKWGMMQRPVDPYAEQQINDALK